MLSILSVLLNAWKVGRVSWKVGRVSMCQLYQMLSLLSTGKLLIRLRASLKVGECLHQSRASQWVDCAITKASISLEASILASNRKSVPAQNSRTYGYLGFI